MMLSRHQQFAIALAFIFVFAFFCLMIASINSENRTIAATPQPPPVENENAVATSKEEPLVIKPYCGDDNCDQDESCATCPADCNNCSPSTKIITYEQPNAEEERQGTIVKKTYTWHYDGDEYGLIGTFDSRTYKLYRDLNHQRDYDLFATSPLNDVLISGIANSIKDMATQYGVPEEEIPSIAVAFVQSLDYTSDDVTTGYDEYPRFPYETLYDNGGDCEDTSILTAAILQELGYGVVLLAPEGHMAVGVACDEDMPGYGLEYEGRRYCYLETTGEGFDFGELPDEYVGKKMQIYPLYQRPALQVSFEGTTRGDILYNYVDLEILVENMGSAEAEEVQVYVALQTTDEDKVWDQHTSERFDLEPDSSTTYNLENLKAPINENFRIYIVAYGTNAISDEAVSDWALS